MNENQNKKYLYQKQYEMLPNRNIILTNPQNAQAYIKEKVNELLSNKDYSKNSEIKQQILKEFIEIYNYDCENTILPEPFGKFKSKEDKEKFLRNKLLVEDTNLYLGNIFANYHEIMFKENYQIPMFQISKMVIDYNAIYHRALNEYFGTYLGINYPDILKFGDKSKHLHAYGTTYMLPALIEQCLSVNIKTKMLHQAIKDINVLGDEKELDLTQEEQELLKIFSIPGDKILAGTEKDTMKIMYNMFVRFNIIKEDSGNEMILVGEAKQSDGKKVIRTIGTLITSNYAKKVIKNEYLRILEILFNSDKLNIRNNIMHNNNITFDYLNINFTAIMMQLLWDIRLDEIFV